MGIDARQNLSSGFPTKLDSNQSPQLQRLARKCNFTYGKFRYDTYQKANNKGTDQSARMRRLVCAYVVRKHRRQIFSRPHTVIMLCKQLVHISLADLTSCDISASWLPCGSEV